MDNFCGAVPERAMLADVTDLDGIDWTCPECGNLLQPVSLRSGAVVVRCCNCGLVGV